MSERMSGGSSSQADAPAPAPAPVRRSFPSNKWDPPDAAPSLDIALERADLQNDTAWLDKHWRANKEEFRMHVQCTCFRWKHLQEWLKASGADPELLRKLEKRPIDPMWE